MSYFVFQSNDFSNWYLSRRMVMAHVTNGDTGIYFFLVGENAYLYSSTGLALCQNYTFKLCNLSLFMCLSKLSSLKLYRNRWFPCSKSEAKMQFQLKHWIKWRLYQWEKIWIDLRSTLLQSKVERIYKTFSSNLKINLKQRGRKKNIFIYWSALFSATRLLLFINPNWFVRRIFVT